MTDWDTSVDLLRKHLPASVHLLYAWLQALGADLPVTA